MGNIYYILYKVSVIVRILQGKKKDSFDPPTGKYKVTTVKRNKDTDGASFLIVQVH